jgi:hypothetical protein
MVGKMKNKYEIRGEITAIFLNNKKHGSLETIINTQDLHVVQKYTGTWYALFDSKSNTFYAYGNIRKPNGKQTGIALHRWILGVDDPTIHVDHVNHDTLRNTQDNLNKVTHSENQQNRLDSSQSVSGHRGVYWSKQKNKWFAAIHINGKRKFLGYFSNTNDARQARNEAEKRYFLYKQTIAN